jgi:hypothetical protein
MAEGKKNKKYGKAKRKPCTVAYNASQRWLSNAEKRGNRQMRREVAQKEHVRAWAVKRLGYEPSDWDFSTPCHAMRKIVRLSSNKKRK